MSQILTEPIRRPVKMPYEPLGVVLEGGKFVYTPVLARRLCVPGIPKSIFYESKALTYGNPWADYMAPRWGQNYRIAEIIRNSGSSVRLWCASYQYSSPTGISGRASICNWNHDKANNKFSFQFYLDNDQEESDASLTDDEEGSGEWCLYDDDEGFWAKELENAGSGSYDINISEETTIVHKGSSSIKGDVVTGGANARGVGIRHTFGGDTDFTPYDFIGVWWYGQNTGDTIKLHLWDGASSWGSYFRWNIVDNFTGWKRFVFPLRDPDLTNGSPDLSSINGIQFAIWDPSGAFTFYADRTVVDVGQWAKVEVYVPDSLTESLDFVLNCWDGAAWAGDIQWDAEDGDEPTWNGAYVYFMDGTTYPDIGLGTAHIGAYPMGERGETKNKIYGSPPATITYSSYYGCIKRVGFAFKLPPDDGQDASDDGISQMKLKVTVYYDSENHTVEDTEGTNDGTRMRAYQVTGKFGYALEFSGNRDHVNIPNDESLKPTDAITVEAWVKRSATTSNRYIATKWGGNGGFTLESAYLASKGKWALYVGGSGQTLNPLLSHSDGAWHHLVGTYNKTTRKMIIYLDGDVDNEQTLSGLPYYELDVSDVELNIGRYGTHYFDGCIDEVRIYNRALTEPEIEANMAGNVTRDGLISEWKFEDKIIPLATYEFEESTNQYYGLQNWNERWLALFDETTKTVEFLIFSERPTSLKVRADKNELIDSIEVGLPAGARVWIGELVHNDLTKDTSDNGVPDFLDLETGLVLYLDFNEGSGSKAHDRSGEGNDGDITGASWVDGKFGRALEFVLAEHDYVTVSDDPSLNPTTGITIAAWFKTTTNMVSVVARDMGGTDRVFFILIHNSYHGHISAAVWNASDEFVQPQGNSGENVDDGEWHFAVVTYDRSNVILYVDGEETDRDPLSGNMKTSDIDIKIGRKGDAGNWDMEGVIDEVRIYNRALTAEEVKRLYAVNVIRYVSIPSVIPKRSWT